MLSIFKGDLHQRQRPAGDVADLQRKTSGESDMEMKLMTLHDALHVLRHVLKCKVRCTLKILEMCFFVSCLYIYERCIFECSGCFMETDSNLKLFRECLHRFVDVLQFLHIPPYILHNYVSFVFYSDYVSVLKGGQRQLAQRCAKVRRDAQAPWFFFKSILSIRSFLRERSYRNMFA